MGVHPYFRDEYVREQLDRKADAEMSDKQREIIEDVAPADTFVTGEVMSDPIESTFQVGKGKVMVQPPDAVHSEGGQVHDASHDISSLSVNLSDEMCQTEHASSSKNKKVKLSDNSDSASSHVQQTSPELRHKIPAKSRGEDNSSDGGSEVSREEGVHTNMFGVQYLMWFEISIEGKSAMNREEEDWGGKLEFGFSDTSFPKEIEDYFLLFEDECSLLAHHNCAARVMGVVSNMKDKLLQPPSYDPRSILDLLDKYGDAHIIDSGCREVLTEEWVA